MLRFVSLILFLRIKIEIRAAFEDNFMFRILIKPVILEKKITASVYSKDAMNNMIKLFI